MKGEVTFMKNRKRKR